MHSHARWTLISPLSNAYMISGGAVISCLNASSICLRIQYDSRTSASEPLEHVVNTMTYLANQAFRAL